MVLRLGKTQNLQKVLSNFLSVFCDFGHISRLSEIYRTFSKGSAKLLFFQSGLLLFFTSLFCISPVLNLSPLCSPSDIDNFFCDLFIRDEYTLLELSVLMASIACFPKAILVNKKDLKRFRRAENSFWPDCLSKSNLYLSQIGSFDAEVVSLMESIRTS